MLFSSTEWHNIGITSIKIASDRLIRKKRNNAIASFRLLTMISEQILVTYFYLLFKIF